MKKLLQFLLIGSALLSGVTAYAYSIRNTYSSNLLCIQIKRPHTTYNIPANNSNDFDNAPSLTIKTKGKYACKTGDGLYTSVCLVSDIQETATFNTDDGSASCSTPVKIH